MGVARGALSRVLGRPVPVAAICALVCALAVEAAPVVGGDLTAQAWWASWAATTRTPVDLGWYGGVPVASYSLLGPWLHAALGLPLTGVLGTVLGAAATTALLGRLHPSPGRWTAAGVVAAGTWAANQWSGRTTFGLAAALGCLALVVASGSPGRGGRAAGALLAAVAGAVSPLASGFLLVAAVAWWSGTLTRPPGLRSGPTAPWWPALGGLLPLAVGASLGAVSGPQPAGAPQMVAALAAAGLTAAVVAPVHRVVRIGAAATAVVLLGTWLVSNPVGSNSTRLVLLFAAPVLVAAARTPPPATVLAVLGVLWLLPPVVLTDLTPRDGGEVAARSPALLAELARRGPVGRVEVVPVHGHEESVWLARHVPLARGWLRQLDTARGPLFYDSSLSAVGYLRWLRDQGVSYVVLPGGRRDWVAHGEAALLRRGVPGLREVWSDGWWRLYEVPGGGVVRGDAVLVASDRARLVVQAAAPGRIELALHWSRWSSVEGPAGCVAPGTRDGWTTLTVHRSGRYVLTSSWRPTGRCA